MSLATLVDCGEASAVDLDDRDMQTLMQALFDIRADVTWIREFLEDEDGEEEEEDDT